MGADAVNGVIDIVTRDVEPGGHRLRLSGGTSVERGAASVPWVGAAPGGGRVGLRLSSFQAYSGRAGQTYSYFTGPSPDALAVVPSHGPIGGGFLLTRWQRPAPGGSELEVAVDANLAPGMRLRSGRTWQHQRSHLATGSLASATDADDPGGDQPGRVAYGHLWWDPRRELQVDGVARAVGAVSDGDVAPYLDLDLRLAWRPGPSCQVWATGRNLPARDCSEWGRSADILRTTRVNRSLLLTLGVDL